MKKSMQAFAAAALGLVLAPAAHAAPVTQVFKDAPAPVSCTTQSAAGIAGLRYCQGAYTPAGSPAPSVPTTVPTFDGTPIDVSVMLPPVPASGVDGNFPVIGVFHGYGGSKIIGSQAPTASDAAGRWLAQGYAVFSMTTRGFWASCGALVPAAPGTTKPAPCANGHIRLMNNAYEVRDAQHLLGKLADEGVIDPTRIGATGGSYGGGLSIQLGALKNRIQLPDGSYQPWTSPAGKAMSVAATVPEYGWTDLVASLMPNGSTLDYASNNSYQGPAGNRRFGVQKAAFNQQLYGGGAQAGYYAPVGSDPKADITAWNTFNSTGGPYDGSPVAAAQIAEFPMHGAMGVDLKTAPAPTLIVNGWNDDLFPVDEALKYYNKVRDAHPTTPISMYHLSIGHSPRSGGLPQTADASALYGAEYAWMDYFVKRTPLATPPLNAAGGVSVATSACNGTSPTAGNVFRATSWAALSPGEVRVTSAAAQTIAPTTQPANDYQSAPGVSVCTDSPSADTAGAAVVRTDPAPVAGYHLVGAPTVVADLSVAGANDAVIGRLYDVDPGAGTQKLISRGVYRPTGVGSSRQVFQLSPQAWFVNTGHVLKLELLGRDAPYLRPSTGQNPVGVANVELRLPTLDGPGAAGGLIKAPAEKVLPAGYTLARDLRPVAAAPDAGTPAPPAVVGPTAPLAPAKDPVVAGKVREGLLKKPTKVRYSGSSLRFTDTTLEAGTLTYRATLQYRSGKGKRRKTITRTLGRAEVKAAAAGSQSVTIKVSSSGRKLLRQHRKAKIRLETRFVTAVEGSRIDTVRKFNR